MGSEAAVTVRFLSNLIVLLLGAFLAAATFAFAGSTLAWLGLGVSATVLVLLLVAFALHGRGGTQRALDIAQMVAAAWTVVGSRTFTDPTRHWLLFGFAAFATAAGTAGLAIHEARAERALRSPVAPAPTGRFVRGTDREPVGVA
jgi:hypothetical protein